MAYKRILTIQDISCVGQCSTTAALPILSAAGHETCILPSAILSTHTAGFENYTYRDLTEDMPLIVKHWKEYFINFDAIYTGYLCNTKQIDFVKDILDACKTRYFTSFVDPVMADNGKLYPAFDQEFVEKMKTLAFSADIIMPNVTEACFLADHDYCGHHSKTYISEITDKLHKLGAKTIIMTGVSCTEYTIGVVISDRDGDRYYEHMKMDKNIHGTGDVFSSAFVAAHMRGKPAYHAAKIAANYTLSCIKNTMSDINHWYGVKFEPMLPQLIEEVQSRSMEF